jgi:hypothetical protein
MKNLLFVLFIIIAYFAQGQAESPVEWSEVQHPSENSITSIYYSDDDYFFTYAKNYYKTSLNGKSNSANKISVSKYSKNGYVKEWTQVVTNYEMDNEYVVFKNIFQVGDEAFVFFENNNLEEGVNKLFLKLVSKDGELSDLEKVDEIQYEEKNSGYFDISVSKNKSKFVILSRHYNKNSNNFKLGLKVFNTSIEKQWEKEILLPVSEKEAKIKYVQVSEDGDVFLMYEDVSARGRATGLTSNYRVLKISKKNSEDYEDLVLDLKHNIENIYIDVDNTVGKTIITALYSKGDYIDGFYAGVIDQNKFEESSSHYNDFPPSFLSQAKGHVKINGKSIKEYSVKYKLKRIFNTDNGGFLLIYEHDFFFMKKNTSLDGSDTGSKKRYEKNHLFVAKMNENGKLEWCEFVPKQQDTVHNSDYSGCIIFYSNNLLTIIFNDNLKNFKQLENNKKLKNHNAYKASGLVAVQIDENGNSTRKLLQDNKKANIRINPVDIFTENMATKDWVIKAYAIKKRKKGEYYLGKINIYKF